MIHNRSHDVIGYGGGYMMTHRQDILDSFENAFRKKGILMVLISQSFPMTEEPVLKEMAEILDKCGIVSGDDMTLPSAVTKMALTLIKQIELSDKMRIMSQSWQGEIS